MADVKFTLIIPSYNGGDYLQECVASIQAQTFADWTLAVLDDGSTDGSLEWLRGLEEPRLTLYLAPEHLGIVGNWARALEIPKAEFMTIIGQDDRLDPDYLTVMDALTTEHPDAGLYHAHFRFMDKRGGLMRPCRSLPTRETAAEYLTALFTGNRDTYGTGYLMRSARYEAVGGIPAVREAAVRRRRPVDSIDAGIVQGDCRPRVLLVPPAPGQRQRRDGLAVVAGCHASLRGVLVRSGRPRPGLRPSLHGSCARLLRRLAAVAVDSGLDAGDAA